MPKVRRLVAALVLAASALGAPAAATALSSTTVTVLVTTPLVTPYPGTFLGARVSVQTAGVGTSRTVQVQRRETTSATWTTLSTTRTASTGVARVSYGPLLAGSYSYRVRVVPTTSAGEAFSAERTVLARPRATTVTGWSTAPATVAAGYSATLPVRVTTQGSVLPRTVLVERRAVGDATWTTTGSTTTDGATGLTSVLVDIPERGSWDVRLVVTATPSAAAAVTETRTFRALAAPRIGVGFVHTCGVTPSGAAKCWGINFMNGELGQPLDVQGTKTPLAVPGLGSGVLSVSVGRSHSCAVTHDGSLYCWGADNAGQLGDGVPSASPRPPVKVTVLDEPVALVSVVDDSTCALVQSGSVRCWGDNTVGQLGDGSTNSSLTPVLATGLTADVAGLTAQDGERCARLETGVVRCWGSNHRGQLGPPATAPVLAPSPVPGLAGSLAGIAVSNDHGCAALTDGTAQCWGVLGLLGRDALPDSGEPGPVPSLLGVTTVVTGLSFSCALTSTGPFCWGENTQGQFGNGTTSGSLLPVAAAVGLPTDTREIAAGVATICALDSAGQPLCWGSNLGLAAGQPSAVSSVLTPQPVLGF